MATSLQAQPGGASPAAQRRDPAPLGVEPWLLLCAGLNAAGWLLSAIHQLNARGYICALVLLALTLVCWEKHRGWRDFSCEKWHRVLRRMRRPFPFAFCVLAMLAFVGGVLYLPDNYDALAYRVPRVLHWLAHGQWHWVHTAFPRLNVRACGQEWLIAPIIALTGSTRATFLPSFISFLLLPGLFYSAFLRFGVKPRAAWHWMWICGSGYCYVTQAGGLANDLLGATFALAAFDFALRLRRSGCVEDLWFFLLAAGLMTGAKASNVPLLLPLALLVLPRWQVVWTKPIANATVILLAALVSFVPTAVLNALNCGDWTGMRLEGPMKPYLTQLGINSVNLVLLNFSPPVCPFAGNWMHFLTATVGLDPNVAHCWSLSEIVEEGSAGLGAGVCVLLVFSLAATFTIRRRMASARKKSSLPLFWKLILWTPYLSLLVFCLKAQTVNSCSRIVMPYWAALVVPWLVFGFDASLLRRRWWKCLAGGVFLMAIALVILSPSRPLWPAQTVTAKLHESHPSSFLLARAQLGFEVASQRPRAFAPLAAALPADATIVGMVTFDDPETSLWWPLGSRRIEHVTPDDDLQAVQSRGVNYILAPQKCQALSWPIEDVIQKFHAEIIGQVPLQMHVSSPAVNWYILKVPPPQ